MSRVGARPSPLPRVSVATGPAVPAWVLRVVVAVVAALVAAASEPNTGEGLLATALVVSFVTHPNPAAPALFAVGAGALLLRAGDGAATWQVAVVVLGVHLVVELAALIDDLPPHAAVEVGLLRAAAVPFVVVQVVAQLLVLIAAWWTGGPPDALWLPAVAGIALAAMAWGVAVRVRDG